MRLFLLPISTRRTLLYCQLPSDVPLHPTRLVNNISQRATKMWTKWEAKDSGWQKSVVTYGNQALKRIPYEEWGLKSVPPLLQRQREDTEKLSVSGGEKVELLFPKTLMSEGRAVDVLRKLALERQGLHKQRMLYSILGMPISAPVALIPVIPNIPFFYLVYRAYSHWRALYGAKHVELLVEKNLVTPQPSTVLDEIYAATAPESALTSGPSEETEVMVLQQPGGKVIAKALGVPALQLEIERAIWQVEKALKAKKELKEEKKVLESGYEGSRDPEKKK